MCSEIFFIGGSRGGREGRTPPPGRPNSFDFMQFSGKFGVFTPPLEGSRPPLGKILDPPLFLSNQLNFTRKFIGTSNDTCMHSSNVFTEKLFANQSISN